MKNKIKNFYRLLALALIIQIVSTVCCLSQNIAYGQNIKSLEAQKQQLISEASQLDQAIAQETSLQSLSLSDDWNNIQELAYVKGQSQALASR